MFFVPQISIFFTTIFADFAGLFGILAEPVLKAVALNRF